MTVSTVILDDSFKINPDAPLTRKFLAHICLSWLQDNDAEYLETHNVEEVEQTLNQLFSILLDLCDMYKFPRHMFVPIVMYAHKFVTKYGIKHNQLFNLLLTSTMVAMKFWDDTTPVTNLRIAETFRYSLGEVRIMEQRFLKGLDYSFSLTVNDVKLFVFESAKLEVLAKKEKHDISSSLALSHHLSSRHSAAVAALV